MAREGLIKNVTFEVQRKAILYDFTCMWTQKKKESKRLIDTEKKLMVAKGGGGGWAK